MPRPRKAADEEQAHVSRRVLVNIRRDQTAVTPRVAWQHELPILELIFGEGNITEVNPDTLDEGFKGTPSASLLPHNKQQDAVKRPSQALGLGWCFVGDPQSEYSRLEQCYGADGEKKMSFVELVFGRFRSGAFERVLGHADIEDLPEDQIRDMLLQAGYQLPIVNWESGEAERKSYADSMRAFYGADKAALLKLAEETGLTVA